MRAQRIQTGLWATRAAWTERRPYLGGEDRSGAGAVVGCLAGVGVAIAPSSFTGGMKRSRI